MNNELWKKIDKHINESFAKSNSKLKKELITSIAINIINSDEVIKKLGKNKWLTIYSELFYGIRKIMSYYDVKFISNHNNLIYGVFETPIKDKIQNVFECAVNLNTFKLHINKKIANNIIDVELEENELILDFGIGLVFSEENYQIKSNQKGINNFFKSESINLSIQLAELANRHENSPILINELVIANFTKQYLKVNSKILDFENYKIENNKIIYGCSLINIDYDQWIKNKI